MTKPHLPDIAKKAERLQLDIETAVRAFPRYHKYTIGTDMRTQAATVVRMCLSHGYQLGLRAGIEMFEVNVWRD